MEQHVMNRKLVAPLDISTNLPLWLTNCPGSRKQQVLFIRCTCTIILYLITMALMFFIERTHAGSLNCTLRAMASRSCQLSRRAY